MSSISRVEACLSQRSSTYNLCILETCNSEFVSRVRGICTIWEPRTIRSPLLQYQNLHFNLTLGLQFENHITLKSKRKAVVSLLLGWRTNDTSVSIKSIQYSFVLVNSWKASDRNSQGSVILFIFNMEGMRRRHKWPLFMWPMRSTGSWTQVEFL